MADTTGLKYTVPSGTSKEDIDRYFEEYLSVARSEGWTDSFEKLGVKVSQKTVGETGIDVIRGHGQINASLKAVNGLLRSIEQRGKWDTFFDSGKIVSELVKDEVAIVHYKTKSSMTVWSRDFCVLTAQRTESDGSITIIGKSIINKELVPEDTSCVRATALLSGFILKAQGENATEVTYIFQVDAAGWVPTAIVNKANTYQPLGIIGMRKALTGSSQ